MGQLGNGGLQFSDAGPVDLGVVDVCRGQLRNGNAGDGCVQLGNVRPVDVRRLDVGGRDLCQRDLGDLRVQVGDVRPVDAGLIDIGCGDLRHGDIGDLRRQSADVRPGDVGGVDVRRGDLRQRNGRQRGVQLVRYHMASRQLFDARRDGGNGFGVQLADRRFGNLGSGDAGVLDVRRRDGRHAHLQRSDRTGLQLSAAHGAHSQLHAGDGAGRQLPGGDQTTLQRVRRRAQRQGGVFLRQAVVGILRHAHGYFHTDARRDHAHAVAQEDVLQKTVLSVLLCVRTVHKVHFERHRRQVAAPVKLRLRRLAHFGIALVFGSGFLFRRGLLVRQNLSCLRYRKVNPLWMGIGADVRAVNVQFGQIQEVPVRVLARGHDARDHVRHVHVVRDAQQVLFLADLYAAVHTHALDEKHVKPVARQLCLVFLNQAAFAQHGLHRIDVLPFHFLCGRCQVRVKRKPMLRQAGR